MEYQDITKHLKINTKKNIGTVIIIVEGEKDEFDLFKQIFVNILNYKYIERKRKYKTFKTYDEFVMKGNENSRVIVLNAYNSNINTLDRNKDYLDKLYIDLYNELGIDVKNKSIYFIWDRDSKSNNYNDVKGLISKLGSANDNDTEMNGLLLLSYPAIQSYIISCYDEKTECLKDIDLKEYIKKKGYKVSNPNKYQNNKQGSNEEIDKAKIIKATKVMLKRLEEMHIDFKETDLDNFSDISLKIFNKEENFYDNHKAYKMLSLISIMLIDLQIIIFKEK